ncbi:MAG: amidohydrolase family protein [Chloroflexota bacterium]
MVATLEKPVSGRRTSYAVIDCDIHPNLKHPKALHPYMSERWRKHAELIGGRGHGGSYYPRANPNAARWDSWPPNGLPPASDLDFMRHQLLDTWSMDYGIFQPLLGAGGQANLEYSQAMADATNEWQLAEWIDLEPRLRAGLVVPYEDGDLTAETIRRFGDNKGFVQLMLAIRTSEPLGRRKYWKMYETACEYDLPVGIHFGGQGGGPITGAGWPSMYVEDHAGMSAPFQSQVASYIFEGVFERFPTLKIVLIEGGFAWAPSLAWRMDQAYKKLHGEVPHLKKLPSEYFAEHFWFTTQPMEEPENPNHFMHLIEQLPWLQDKLMFATDYPHWDFDAPDEALPKIKLPEGFEPKVMAENARKLYKLA